MKESLEHHLASSGRLLRLFEEGFTVMDLAEPLFSLDHHASRAEAKSILLEERREYIGVRRNGRVVGFLALKHLEGEGGLDHYKPFVPEMFLKDTAGIAEALASLTDHESIFITVLGEPTCIVHRRHIEKPAMRMWLFGIISLIEMNTTSAVHTLYEESEWTSLLTEARLEKAYAMQAERERRGQAADLFSCLQFSDKLQILIKEDDSRKYLKFESRREADRILKRLESLRNNLAHGQPLLDDNWQLISNLSTAMESVVRGTRMKEFVDQKVASSTKD